MREPEPQDLREGRESAAPEGHESPARYNGARSERLPLHPVTPDEAVAEAELAHAPEDLPALSPPSPTWRARLVPALPISCGAVLGANARYLVGLWVAARWPGAFPWGTLLINVTGSLIIGFYLTLVTERFAGRATTRLFIATGFLGAYTTFSTFSYETVMLVRQGLLAAAIGYVVASLVLGLAAVVAGTLAAHAL